MHQYSSTGKGQAGGEVGYKGAIQAIQICIKIYYTPFAGNLKVNPAPFARTELTEMLPL
jgi:hypothetical protein